VLTDRPETAISVSACGNIVAGGTRRRWVLPKIALNGLGRIGKLALRALFDRGHGPDIVLLNDLTGTPEQHAL